MAISTLTRFLQIRVIDLGKHFNTHGVHLLESEFLQAFLATIIIRDDVIIRANVEVETLQSKKYITVFNLHTNSIKSFFAKGLTNIVHIVVLIVKSAIVKLSPAANSLPSRRELSTSNDFFTFSRFASLTKEERPRTTGSLIIIISFIESNVERNITILRRIIISIHNDIKEYSRNRMFLQLRKIILMQ